MTGQPTVDVRLQEFLLARARAGTHCRELTGFTVSTDPTSENPYRNYAVPSSGATPTDADIDDLVRMFAALARPCRVEHVLGAAPGVEPALDRAGFLVELEGASMASDRGHLRQLPAPQGVTLGLVGAKGDADMADSLHVARDVFDEPATTASDRRRIRHVVENGGGVIVARRAERREPIGTARFDPVIGGVTEITGVAIREPHRGHGTAAAMVSALARHAFDRGAALAWLLPAADGLRTVYERAGFIEGPVITHRHLVP